MRNLKIPAKFFFVWKTYIKKKNQVTDQKNGLLYLAREMCDQTQDKGLADGAPLKGAF